MAASGVWEILHVPWQSLIGLLLGKGLVRNQRTVPSHCTKQHTYNWSWEESTANNNNKDVKLTTNNKHSLSWREKVLSMEPGWLATMEDLEYHWGIINIHTIALSCASTWWSRNKWRDNTSLDSYPERLLLGSRRLYKERLHYSGGMFRSTQLSEYCKKLKHFARFYCFIRKILSQPIISKHFTNQVTDFRHISENNWCK